MHDKSFAEIRDCPPWMFAFNTQDDFRSWKKAWTFKMRMKMRIYWHWERYCRLMCIILGVSDGPAA